MLTQKIIKYLIITFFILFLSSCSKKEAIKPSVRAIERWNALIEYDWKKAYSFETPSYRKNYTIKDFRTSFGQAVQWKEVDLKSTSKVNDNLVNISLTLVSAFSGGSVSMNIPSLVKERWQLIDGTWWHIKE